jgi:divalent metal cation (Fe/Co/Zn/Cd) transporter
MTRTGKRAAYALVGGTLAYNVIEGVVAIASGIEARSVVLVSFGFDSYLEVAAAAAVLWRLSAASEEVGEQREERALRVIGASFMLLALGVFLQATLALASGRGAGESTVGLALLVLSLTVMPVVSFGKLWAAARWDVPSLASEARETIACSYLSLTALGGVAATAIAGWWWIDAVFALVMIPWLVREGREGLRGEACFDDSVLCFCRECWFGVRSCPSDCCAAAA